MHLGLFIALLHIKNLNLDSFKEETETKAHHWWFVLEYEPHKAGVRDKYRKTQAEGKNTLHGSR